MAITQAFVALNDQISHSELPLLVIFYSPLCGPSHLMDATFQQIDEQMQQQLQIIKIDAEEHAELASEYEIHPLPTLLLFKNGKLLERIEEERTENIASADRLIERLQNALQNESNSPVLS